MDDDNAVTFTYIAGNVTAWSGNVYTYGPFNETWKTNSSGDEWIHLYDANDQRVWSFGVAGTGANRNRWTLRGFDDKVLREYTFTRSPASWTLERELIHRGPGQLLAAVLDGGGQRHYHLDHLGSPRLVTDASGAKVAFHSYFPYGEEATPLGQDGTRNKFTGHERDLGNAGSQADDLDYMHARYHNPLVGRFLSVDPAGSSAKLGAPQSWNRYTYGRLNPLRYIDFDGREAEDAANRAAISLMSSSGALLVQDAAVRSWYMMSSRGLAVQPTEVASATRQANLLRARRMSSGVSAAIAESMKPSTTKPRPGGRAHVTRQSVNRLVPGMATTGGVLLLAGSASAAHNVAQAPEGQRAAAAATEVSSAAFAFGGAWSGGHVLGGAGMLLGGPLVGIPLAIVGTLGGGYMGGEVGADLASHLMLAQEDAEQEAPCGKDIGCGPSPP